MEFCGGDQWRKENEVLLDVDPNIDRHDPRYVANITLRHVQQKVSALYARNPKVNAKRRKKIISKVWDGTQAQVMAAMQLLGQNPMNPKAMQIITDFNTSLEYNQLMDKIAETTRILYEYQVSEQDYPFKSGMKRMVRRAVTCGVGVAMQMVLTAEPIDAQQALQCNMVAKVVAHEHLLGEAEKLAGHILRNSQRAVRSAKETILDVIGRPLDDQLRIEGWNSYTCLDQTEARELLGQFFDKSDRGRAGPKQTGL